jgi:hypothetical protein
MNTAFPSRSTRVVSGVLWLLWLGCLATGFLPNGWRWNGFSPLHPWLVSSVVLVAAGWWHCLRSSSHAGRWFAGLVAAGMTCGCGGDCSSLLAGKVSEIARLLLVMGLFGLGHVGYISACFVAQRSLKLRLTPLWFATVAFWLAVGVATWAFIVAPTSRPLDIRLAGLGYTLFLASCAGCMWGLATLNRRFFWMALGAALFLASDAVLAAEIYRGGTSFLTNLSWVCEGLDFSGIIGGSRLCWIAYGPGQMLLVFGAASGLHAFERQQSTPPQTNLPQKTA